MTPRPTPPRTSDRRPRHGLSWAADVADRRHPRGPGRRRDRGALHRPGLERPTSRRGSPRPATSCSRSPTERRLHPLSGPQGQVSGDARPGGGPRRRRRGDADRQPAGPPARPRRARHRGRPHRHAPLPARLPVCGARQGQRPLAGPRRAHPAAPRGGPGRRGGHPDRARPRARCGSPAAAAWRGTTWSSRPAPGWSPSEIPGLVEGAHRVLLPGGRAAAARGAAPLQRRPGAGRRRRHPLQVPTGTGGVHAHARRVPAPPRRPRPRPSDAAVAR